MPEKLPVIWKLSVVQFELGTAIDGVALRRTRFYDDPEKFLSHQAVAICRSYANKPHAGKDLFVMADKKVHAVTTDNQGEFSLWLKDDRVDYVEVYVDAARTTIIPVMQLYPIYYPLGKQSLEIISDIDDTILQSYTNVFFHRVPAILFTQPRFRETINFTKSLLLKAKESGMRIYCISRSESNLFHLLTNILTLNQLTGLIVYLSGYLNYFGLLTAKKKHFKFQQIVSILQKSPGKRYYLIGDDTQNDIRTYFEIAEKFPGRICKVFIRQTKTYYTRFQKFYYERLLKLEIPVFYFDQKTPFDDSLLNT